MTRKSRQRQAAYRLGHGAEWIAALYLTLKGYRILARRFLARSGEIDLVALRGSVIAFVEVKARRDFVTGIEAINSDKQRKLSFAVDEWLGRNSWASHHVLRGDAIIISPWRWPRHIEDAFALSFA